MGAWHKNLKVHDFPAKSSLGKDHLVFCMVISLKRLIYLTLSGSLSFIVKRLIGLRIFSLTEFSRHLHLSKSLWFMASMLQL
jgi:hypothetical protein